MYSHSISNENVERKKVIWDTLAKIALDKKTKIYLMFVLISDFHNMDHDEYVEDDLGSSVSSYTDEVQLSRSMEHEFMFRRGGNTPKMSHFFGRTNSVSSVPEEDEDAGNEADSDDSSSLSRYALI